MLHSSSCVYGNYAGAYLGLICCSLNFFFFLCLYVGPLIFTLFQGPKVVASCGLALGRLWQKLMQKSVLSILCPKEICQIQKRNQEICSLYRTSLKDNIVCSATGNTMPVLLSTERETYFSCYYYCERLQHYNSQVPFP